MSKSIEAKATAYATLSGEYLEMRLSMAKHTMKNIVSLLELLDVLLDLDQPIFPRGNQSHVA